MEKKRKKSIVKYSFFIFIILLVGSYIYSKMTNEVPNKKPSVTIEYNEKIVPIGIGEHTWSGNLPEGQKAGSSYIVGPSYDIGMSVSRFSAKSNGEIKVIFNYAPVKMTLNSWIVGNKSILSTEEFNSKKEYTIALPNEKAEYIFEVKGYWNEENDTSTIFRVLVE